MKAAPFEYLRARHVDEAVAALAADNQAKIIAGGQSLVPLMAMRLARPSVLVDVNDLGLDSVVVTGDELSLGAGTRHRALERDPTVARTAPLLAEAAALIGYPAIRVRGTIGGSLAHADPVAELPAVLVALRGAVVVRGPDGERRVDAADLFTGFLSTSLEPDEMIVEVRVPAAAGATGGAFCEWAPRSGDFAVAGVGVQVERSSDGTCVSVRGAACGIGGAPVDCTEAVVGVLGEREASDGLLRDVGRWFGDRELHGLLAARALHRALSRSGLGAVA